MARSIIRTVGFILCLFAGGQALGENQSPNEVIGNPLLDSAEAINAGRGYYRQICIVCHLKAGGRGPKLFRTTLAPTEFLRIVLDGRKDTLMPAFRDRLSEEDVWQLHAFVMSRDQY